MQDWQEIERSFPMDNPEVREYLRDIWEFLENAPQAREEMRQQTAAMQATMARLEEAVARRRAAQAASVAKLPQ